MKSATKLRVEAFVAAVFAVATVRAQQDPQPPAQTQEKKDVPAARARLPITGQYMTSFNSSTLGTWNPSLNHKLNVDYRFAHRRTLDLRVEYYTEGSYNADPPGQLRNNVNEQKFETQLTYAEPLNGRLSLFAAVLHHENFRFPDTYAWGLLGVTYIVPLGRSLVFTNNLSAEKRLSGGRVFYDYSGTVDWTFRPGWTLEGNLHQYENYGQTDLEPSRKQEYEIGVIRQLPTGRFVALSWFRHLQFGAPNDQFSSLKLKFGFGF